MDLNATRMFVGVVQAGSLSAAATRLGIPLPTLSRRIRDLERQLKVPLLERFGLPDEPDALHRFPCAVWASRIDVLARWELGGHVIEPKAVLATNDYHHLCSRALGGGVVTELPPFLAAAPIREQRLVPLLPQYPLPEW